MRYLSAITVLAFVLSASLLAVAVRGAPSPGNKHLTEAKLVFVGDLTLGRYVGASLQKAGYDSAFTEVRGFLSGADVAVGNLEGPLVPSGSSAIPAPSVNEPLLTESAAAAPTLSRAGFDMLSVANNHSMDAGKSGLQATVSALQSAGIYALGVEQGGSTAPIMREVRGLQIAFLGYTLIAPNQPSEQGATPAPAYIDPSSAQDRQRMADDIRRARLGADVVIAFMHWGTEYAAQPDAAQDQFAKVAAAAGADLVVGSHPHVAQGMELIKNGARSTVVAYSLGNALFDQAGRPDATQGLALEATVDQEGVRTARLVPLKINTANGSYAMSMADDASGQETLQRAALSTSPELKWQGTWAVSAKPGIELAYRRTPLPTSSSEDLGMDGPSNVTLDSGTLFVSGTTSGQPVEWKTEQGWRVTGYTAGDADGDGKPELVYTVWKPGLTWSRPSDGGMSVNMEGGQVLPHIYINGWRQVDSTWAMRPVWQGSPRPAPVVAVAIAPIGKEGKPVLASLDSSDPHVEKTPGTINIWQWTGGFGFELVSTPPGQYSEMWSDGRVLLFR